MADLHEDEGRDSQQPRFAAPVTEGVISQLIVAASADGIVAVDDQGVIRICNRAAEELLARPADELIGALFGFPVVAGRAAEVELMLPGGGERVVELRPPPPRWRASACTSRRYATSPIASRPNVNSRRPWSIRTSS